jgi:flagellar biosynthesis GTPase FlhF
VSTPAELLEALGREARARLGGGGDGPTRVYRGRSVEELVPQIQRELGSEAIIVRRREGLTGGVFGFFQRTYVEIEARPGGPGIDLYDEQDAAQPTAPTYTPLPALSPASAPSAALAPQQQAPPPAPSTPAPPAFAAPMTAPPAPSPSVPVQSVFAQPATPAAATQRQPPPEYRSPLPPTSSQPPSAQARTPSVPRVPSAPYLQRVAPTLPLTQAPSPTQTPPPLQAPRASAESSAPFARPAPVPPRRPAPAPAPSPFYAREPAGPPSPGAGGANVTAHLASLARASGSKIPPPPPTPDRRSEPVAWSSEFQELEPSDVPELFPPALERAEPEPVPRQAPSEHRVVAAGSHARARAGVAKSLQRFGISEELAAELIDAASAHAIALAPRAGMAQAVRMTLAQRIPVASALPSKGAAIVVVGAGGAGKTTCCAALLGAYRKSSSLPASFATITRENEREELRMLLTPYIMKPTPARTPRALRALRRARGDGVAVLDTPSLSPSDRAGIRELAGLLAELKPERVVVALPATLGAAAAAQLLQALRPLGANSLAVTHADETDQIGVAVEAACRFELAPEYVLDRGRGGAWRISRVDPAGLAARLLQ